MSAPSPSHCMGRIAVFTLPSGRTITNLTTAPLYEYVSSLPDFSHWGTEEFVVDLIQPPREKGVA